MQVFLRTLEGDSRALRVDESLSVAGLKLLIEDLLRIPAPLQRLGFQSRELPDDRTLADCGLERDSTIALALRSRGGKPVKVLMMTDHLPCGKEVVIDAEEDTDKHTLMMRLQEATGVPIEHQVLRLGGLNQLMLGDRRTNVKFNISCGVSSNIQFAVNEGPKGGRR